MPPSLYLSLDSVIKKKTCALQVNLGVLHKNEQYEEDMIDILRFVHDYVPGNNELSESKPVKCLSGGDYLTFERHKEAQSAMQDARTPSSRLEGLIPKIEDFHTQMEWMQVLLLKYKTVKFHNNWQFRGQFNKTFTSVLYKCSQRV